MRFLLFCLLSLAMTSACLAQNWSNGTVIVWENGNNLGIIQRHTNSNKTHVAIVLYDGQQPYVYEAAVPNVHRYTTLEYMKQIHIAHKKLPKLKIHFLPPKVPYTNIQLHNMTVYANSQIGRPFSVKSYILNRTLKTIHCAEYVGQIMAQSRRIQTLGPRETPQTIYEKAMKL